MLEITQLIYNTKNPLELEIVLTFKGERNFIKLKYLMVWEGRIVCDNAFRRFLFSNEDATEWYELRQEIDSLLFHKLPSIKQMVKCESKAYETWLNRMNKRDERICERMNNLKISV